MAVFTPAEEVQSISMAPWDMAGKAERNFFREELVEEPRLTMLTEDLAVVVVLVDAEEAVEAEEDTPVEAVEVMFGPPVGEGEGLSTMEQIRKMTAVTTQQVMVM